jgi:hypothetical protein
MANYVCRYTGFKPLDRDIINVLVPAGEELKAGQVVMVKTLVSGSTIYGNKTVFESIAPATADLGLYPALILNGGELEELADKRRPEGNPDYTTFGYKAGALAPAIILFPGNEIELSFDAIDGVPAVGKFLEPADGEDFLVVANTRTSGVKSALKILATNKFRAGGLFGTGFYDTVIAKVLE